MVATAAATQAPMDNISRTRPRLKAISPDSRMIPATPRSTKLTGRSFMAGSSTGVLLGKTLDQLRKVVDGMQLEAACRAFPAAAERRDQGVGKAQFLRLLEALLDLAHGADFAPQADFAEHHHAGGDRPVESGGNESRGHGQIRGRLADSQAPGDVQIHIIP